MSALDEPAWGATFFRLAAGDNPTNYNEVSKIENLRMCDENFLSKLSKMINFSLLNKKQKELVWKWAYHILDMNQCIQSMVCDYYDYDVRTGTLVEVRVVIFKIWLARILLYISGLIIIMVSFNFLNN